MCKHVHAYTVAEMGVTIIPQSKLHPPTKLQLFLFFISLSASKWYQKNPDLHDSLPGIYVFF